MKRVLFKRYIRDIKKNFFRYFALFLLIAVCMFLVVAIVDSAYSIIEGTKELQERTHLEDCQVTLFNPFTEEEIKAIEDKGVTVESHSSFDYTLEDDTVLRIFANREKIDLVTLDEGKEAETHGEIVLLNRYAAEKNIKVGDTIKLGEEEYIVTGIGSSPDYDAPYRKLSDTSIDSSVFGTAFVCCKDYDILIKDRQAGTEDVTYAFLLNDALSSDELKQMIKDFEFDYKKVEDPYYKEMLEDTYGKRDEIQDGINDLVDGVDELYDGMEELVDGVDELKDGTSEFKDGLHELYDGVTELKDGAVELKDGVKELKDGVKDLKDESDEMLDKIFSKSPDNITQFMNKGENIRIGGAAGDVEVDKTVGLYAGVMVIVLLTYVLSVFVIHQIKTESSVIGALYSLGAKKSDLVLHYIFIPTMVAFLGGTLGGLLGMSRFGCKWQMADCYSYFSIPDMPCRAPLYLVIYAVVMPAFVSAIVNFLVINKSLSRTALSLLRNEQKISKGKEIKLGKMSFISTYRIRQIIRERRTAITVIFGMIISLLIFMLGMDCYVLCESVGRLNSQDTKYNYMYTYKYPTKEPPEGGEPCYITTLKREQYGYNLDITIIGIDDDNPYFGVKPVKGKNKIVASDAIVQRYHAKVGDKIVFTDTAEDIDYAFTIEDVVPYSVGITVFMDIDSMRELFGEEDDYYNVILSDEKLDIEEGRLYSVTSKADIDKAAGIFLKLMVPTFSLLIVMSIIIFCIVMYLMLSVMIDRAKTGISLLKILGYRDREVKKLYLDGNRIVIMLGALISIPTAKKLIDILFPSFIANVACSMHLEFKWYFYLLIFGTIMLLYEIINLILMRKINKISENEILKNRE